MVRVVDEKNTATSRAHALRQATLELEPDDVVVLLYHWCCKKNMVMNDSSRPGGAGLRQITGKDLWVEILEGGIIFHYFQPYTVVIESNYTCGWVTFHLSHVVHHHRQHE